MIDELKAPPPYPRSITGPGGKAYTFDDALLAVPLGGRRGSYVACERSEHPSREAALAALHAAHPRREKPGHHSHHLFGSTLGPVEIMGWTWTTTYAALWPASDGVRWYLAMIPPELSDR